MLLNVAAAAYPTALFTAAVALFSAKVTFSQLQLLSSFLALPPFPFSYAVSKSFSFLSLPSPSVSFPHIIEE